MGARSLVMLASAAAVLATAAPASARTLVVDDDAGCRDARYSTISAATAVARSGDVVKVCDGVYPESVQVLAQGVRLEARTPLGATIKAPAVNTSGSSGLVDFQGGAGQLRGFVLEGPVAPGPYGCPEWFVIAFARSDATRAPTLIDGNRMRNMTCTDGSHVGGMYLEDSPAVVTHNELSGYQGTGIATYSGAPVTISANVLKGTPTSYGISFCCNGKVQSNTVDDNGQIGILSEGFEADGFQARVIGNTLRRNGDGISMEEIGQGVENGVGSTVIQRNTVLDSLRDGIRTVDSEAIVLRGNRSLGSGGFDCFSSRSPGVQWGPDNIGVTDSPPELCRKP